MSISTTIRRAGPFTGNGTTTAFSFAFKVFADTDLQVVQADLLGAEEVLTLDSDYSVALNADQDENPGGTVTLSSALVEDYTLAILSGVPQTQLVVLTNMGAFFPGIVNTALDRLTVLIQQLQEEIDRSIKLPLTADAGDYELPLPEANQLLGWNGAADGVVNIDPADLVQVAAYGTTVHETFDGDGTTVSFTLPSSPGSLGNLRVSIDGVVQVASADYTWSTGTTLVFTSAPPDGTVIFVQYQEALGEAPDASDRAKLDGSNFSSVTAPAFLRSIGQAPTSKGLGILGGATGSNSDADTVKMLQALEDYREIVISAQTDLEPYIFDAPLLCHSQTKLVGAAPWLVTLKASPDRAAHDPILGNITIVPAWDPTDNSPADDRDYGLYFDNLILDGNRTNNASQGEWGHGLYLRAAKDVYLGPGMMAKDCQGDGLSLSYGYELGGGSNTSAYCSDVRGWFRSTNSYRQGVALISAEDFDLALRTWANDLYGCDLEADSALQVLRRGKIKLMSYGDGTAHGDVRDGNTMTGGGFAAYGAGATGFVDDVEAWVNVVDTEGYGVTWRQAKGLRLRGIIDDADAGAIVGGSGGSVVSRVDLDLTIKNPSGVISSRGSGDRVTGRVEVQGADTGGSSAFLFENNIGCEMEIIAPDGGAQQALNLTGTTNSRFRGAVKGFNSYGAWLKTGATGNDFNGMDLSGNGLTNGSIAILEDSGTGTDNNSFRDVKVGASDTVTLTGTGSSFEGRMCRGSATWDPGSVANGATVTTTVTVTGARLGDQAWATFSLTLGGLIMSAYVSASNTVTVVLLNNSGGAVDLASGTVRAFSRKVI